MSVKFMDKRPDGFARESRIVPFKFPGGETHLRVPDDYDDVPYYATVKGAEMDEPPTEMQAREIYADSVSEITEVYPSQRQVTVTDWKKVEGS